MSTLTIHALEPEVERRIRVKAKKEHKSLNQTMKQLLAESVGSAHRAAPDRREDFKEFHNVWTEEEARVFETHTADLQTIDQEDWA